ncbi:MAG: protein kinase family protein, partial [Marinobacter sp.]
MPQPSQLQQFYIPEEQSVYLLSHDDARKLKDWVELCTTQLRQMGYADISMIGKGAYGFVFAGRRPLEGTRDLEHVFKFTRITLPQHLHDRLEDEAYILEQVEHPRVPGLIAFHRAGSQPILVMERAPGFNLEEVSLEQGRLSPRLIIRIADQLADILRNLRRESDSGGRPIVHGDIKPSNLVFDAETENIALIDWGSSVFAQLDANQQFLSPSVMELMS